MSRKSRASSSIYVELQPGSPLRSLVMGLVPADQTIEVPLIFPSLDGAPTPKEKARVLLEAAAEVEHALMVQYLYAYFSLKRPSDAHPAGMDAAIEDWGVKILDTAIEEMGHMMTVQNLLVGIGLPPNVEREDIPFLSDLYPFPYHLEPLTERSLAKYVFAEAPSSVPAGAEEAFERIRKLLNHQSVEVNHVAVLYALLGIVFSTSGDDGSDDPEGDLKRFKESAAALAREIVPNGQEAAWHLPNEAWAQPLTPQAAATDWSMSSVTTGGTRRVLLADSREAAMNALADVASQGEGPGGTIDGDSHFSRFFAIFNGSGPVVRFPGPGWDPVRPVLTDPVLPEHAAAGGQVISDPLAQAYARVANSSYAVILGLIQHYMFSSAANRTRIARAAWRIEMKERLVPLQKFLATRPHSSTGEGSATLPFALPTPVNLPTAEPQRKQALASRYNEGIQRIDELVRLLQQAGQDPADIEPWREQWIIDRDRFTV